VKPETVVGWHRVGFRLYWQRLSRRGMRRGRPAVPGEVRELIRRMAAENQCAPRIHGELLRLGFNVSERTLSRYLHLDVGVGTGYFLDRCTFPVAAPEVHLMDLNPNCLEKTARRIRRYRPVTHRCNVLDPIR
jgi:hypothetical protein